MERWHSATAHASATCEPTSRAGSRAVSSCNPSLTTLCLVMCGAPAPLEMFRHFRTILPEMQKTQKMLHFGSICYFFPLEIFRHVSKISDTLVRDKSCKYRWYLAVMDTLVRLASAFDSTFRFLRYLEDPFFATCLINMLNDMQVEHQQISHGRRTARVSTFHSYNLFFTQMPWLTT